MPTKNNPARMMAAVTDSMKERTGKSLEEWVALVQASGVDPLDQKAVRHWLKSEHGVLQNSQWAIADAAARAAGWVRPSVEEYINSQYEGAKAKLRPLFDALRDIIENQGEDVRVEGRGGYTPFVRRRQFAVLQASTKTRIDLGLRFTDPPESALLNPGNPPGQCSHKIAIHSLEDITQEVKKFINLAYNQNA